MFDKLKKIADQAKEKAAPLAGQATQKAAELAAEAKEKAGPLAEQAKERATELAGKAAPAVSQGVDKAAGGLDKATGAGSPARLTRCRTSCTTPRARCEADKTAGAPPWRPRRHRGRPVADALPAMPPTRRRPRRTPQTDEQPDAPHRTSNSA